MPTFDYKAPADLFASTNPGIRKGPIQYHRFDTSASAIQFVMEQLSPMAQNSSVLQVGEERFDASGIRDLYESARYPLKRKK